ncbi:unnamed protein product (macronuclear) [Paramecium tetraurelia]|uniref:Uncharacterized protein n=1 Tax=Paramecium tetraurelia TaxID=5888 RepID=A0BHD0_PARTE|nr:uncharacterized protein GSPATT00028982001 [Paramecium tetraurelia]CAK57947.1 unnamed protein product [Paramecium tetraurelia]|eukprot:XP_001425345.1 hypothetical protein (macronuclear) [Paramecium tetraurelia strain d4-2]
MNNLGISNNRFQQKAQQKRQKSFDQPHPNQKAPINNQELVNNHEFEITPDIVKPNVQVPIFQDPKLIENLQQKKK